MCFWVNIQNTSLNEAELSYVEFNLIVRLTKVELNRFCRPQQSCEGYVFTPVCDSVTGGGGCLPKCMLGYTPPSGPEADTSQDQVRHPLGPGKTPPPGPTPSQVRHPSGQIPPSPLGQKPPRSPPPRDGHCCGR